MLPDYEGVQAIQLFWLLEKSEATFFLGSSCVFRLFWNFLCQTQVLSGSGLAFGYEKKLKASKAFVTYSNLRPDPLKLLWSHGRRVLSSLTLTSRNSFLRILRLPPIVTGPMRDGLYTGTDRVIRYKIKDT